MAIALPQGDARRRLRQKYGEAFPDLTLERNSPEFAQQLKLWLSQQREQLEPAMRDRRLHWARHRHFRIGNQHISSRDGRTWREPGEQKNRLRATWNMIGPALDFRHGVIAEQRPGFRHELLKATIDARETAEAQQAVAEHYFHRLKAWNVMRDAIHHAQTDGICFVQVYVDKLAGKLVENVMLIDPQDERAAGYMAQGYKLNADGLIAVPLSESGEDLPPEAQIALLPEGDLACRTILAHDTFVDPEARTLNGTGDRARWFAVRRPRDLKIARIITGNEQLQSDTLDTVLDPMDYPTENVHGWSRGLPPFPMGQRLKHKEAVYEWMVFIAPDGQDIQEGMWVQVIGDTVVDSSDELPGGVYPFARFTDGSTDPSFYPRPVVSDYIGDQIAINAQASLIMQHTRINGLGRLMALKGTLIEESYTTLVGSTLYYEGMKPEQLKPMSVGSDAWQLLETLIRKLEDKHGWNDIARGQVLGQSGGGMQDVSGRAVLGAQEALARTFGPMVQAAAEGATEWSEIVVKYAGWMFGDTPRMIPTVGGRGDLAKKVTKEQLEEDCCVYVDAATLMPQPAQLRQQTLTDLLQRGLITIAEYQKRAPFAEIRNVYMGDMDHFQRAQWINTLLEENWEQYTEMLKPDPMAPLDPMTGQPQAPSVVLLYSPGTGLPVLWQDDPAVHLGALSEIVLNERKPWPLRKLAMDRSTIYEQLAQAKMDPMQPVPLEVLGVPLNRLQSSAAPTPALVPTPEGGPAVVPGNSAQAAVAPAPGLSSAGAPSASTEVAEPLGSVGAAESGLA